jgi:hypothetical protein
MGHGSDKLQRSWRVGQPWGRTQLMPGLCLGVLQRAGHFRNTLHPFPLSLVH